MIGALPTTTPKRQFKPFDSDSEGRSILNVEPLNPVARYSVSMHGAQVPGFMIYAGHRGMGQRAPAGFTPKGRRKKGAIPPSQPPPRRRWHPTGCARFHRRSRATVPTRVDPSLPCPHIRYPGPRCARTRPDRTAWIRTGHPCRAGYPPGRYIHHKRPRSRFRGKRGFPGCERTRSAG